MDFSGSLDLCLSCGNHVADGTPYCSTRCLSLDRSVRYTQSSSSHPQHASSSPAQSTSTHQRRRPLIDYNEPSSSSHSSDEEEQQQQLGALEEFEEPSHARKLASIAEWAQGVWGGADDDDKPKQQQQRPPVNPSHIGIVLPAVAPTKVKASASPSSSTKGRRPKFTLSAAHVAPPAMSIATTTTARSSSSRSDEDNSSIMTPSSSSRSPSAVSVSPRMIGHRRKPSSTSSVVDPWIASPPYEFAYNHKHPTSSSRDQLVSVVAGARGRTLARA